MSAHQFKAGDPVVCVDAEWHGVHPLGLPCPLVANQVYHIASITPATGAYRGKKDHVSLRLVEVRNEGFWIEGDMGFASIRFRPVQKRTTSIAIFQSLLTPTPSEIAEVQLEDSVAEFEELVHLGQELLR